MLFWCYQQEQLLGSLDNFEPETPDTEDDEVGLYFYGAILRKVATQKHTSINQHPRLFWVVVVSRGRGGLPSETDGDAGRLA